MKAVPIIAAAIVLATACGPPPTRCESGPIFEDVGMVLDDWHEAASVADFDRYFGHFADDAVFLGTDASERWTVDELLRNEKYGELRGTAVLRREGMSEWKIVHYSMTFLVPNEVAGDVVERIRAGG